MTSHASSCRYWVHGQTSDGQHAIKSRGRRPWEARMLPAASFRFGIRVHVRAPIRPSVSEETDRPGWAAAPSLVRGSRRSRCWCSRCSACSSTAGWRRHGGVRRRRRCGRRISRCCRCRRCRRAAWRSPAASVRVVASADGQANTGDCDTKCRAIHDFLLT